MLPNYNCPTMCHRSFDAKSGIIFSGEFRTYIFEKDDLIYIPEEWPQWCTRKAWASAGISCLFSLLSVWFMLLIIPVMISFVSLLVWWEKCMSSRIFLSLLICKCSWYAQGGFSDPVVTLQDCKRWAALFACTPLPQNTLMFFCGLSVFKIKLASS